MYILWFLFLLKLTFNKFFENAGEDIAKSGHILESTEVTMLTN